MKAYENDEDYPTSEQESKLQDIANDAGTSAAEDNKFKAASKFFTFAEWAAYHWPDEVNPHLKPGRFARYKKILAKEQARLNHFGEPMVDHGPDLQFNIFKELEDGTQDQTERADDSQNTGNPVF